MIGAANNKRPKNKNSFDKIISQWGLDIKTKIPESYFANRQCKCTLIGQSKRMRI